MKTPLTLIASLSLPLAACGPEAVATLEVAVVHPDAAREWTAS